VLVEPLGSGGFGEVWKAQNRETRGLSAFKFFFGSVAPAIRNEARVLDGIHRTAPRDGVVRLLASGLDSERPWLQFEYLEAGDLSAKLAAWKPDSDTRRAAEATGVIRVLARTVAELHDAGVIHRDLKPSNVLLRRGQRERCYRPVIADFGISHALPREVAAAHSGFTSKTAAIRAFTERYASPQQRRPDSEPDKRDDVYALGVLWYQMLVNDLTAERPEVGWDERLHEAGVNRRVVELLRACLHVDPHRRPADAGELFGRLRQLQQQLQPPDNHRDLSCYGHEMRFALCPPGTFDMGSDSGVRDEGPVRRVTLTRPCYMGIYPVTQAQWKAVMGDNPSECKHDDRRPVEMVSWLRAKEFCQRLTAYLHRRGEIEPWQHVRLPTEAEWEYACRAGTTTAFHTGDDETRLRTAAWCGRLFREGTRRVREGRCNPWGLFDMHGNVWEWCEDWYAKSYDPTDTTDPAGPRTGLMRVHRGGSWRSPAQDCRSARRKQRGENGFENTVGFRVCFTSR
jgi:formylglycine-generating enzyme required for sulfatase activity